MPLQVQMNLCLYADPAYPLRVYLQAPFRDAVAVPQIELFQQLNDECCSNIIRIAFWWYD